MESLQRAAEEERGAPALPTTPQTSLCLSCLSPCCCAPVSPSLSLSSLCFSTPSVRLDSALPPPPCLIRSGSTHTPSLPAPASRDPAGASLLPRDSTSRFILMKPLPHVSPHNRAKPEGFDPSGMFCLTFLFACLSSRRRRFSLSAARESLKMQQNWNSAYGGCGFVGIGCFGIQSIFPASQTHCFRNSIDLYALWHPKALPLLPLIGPGVGGGAVQDVPSERLQHSETARPQATQLTCYQTG